MVDKRKFLFDQTDTLCSNVRWSLSVSRHNYRSGSPFRCSPVNFGIFDIISLGRDIRCSESEGILLLFEDFTKVLEGEKNRRVEGEEIFNSREYKRDVMVSARRIRLIQRKSFQYKVIRGFFACRK